MRKLRWVNHEQWWMRAWQQQGDKKGKMMLGRACSCPFSFHVLPVWRKKVIFFSRKNVLRERVIFFPFLFRNHCAKEERAKHCAGSPCCLPSVVEGQTISKEKPHRKCIPVWSRGDCGQRYIGIRSQGEHTLAYSMCWLFWQTTEPGLIKCSDKNQSFIKVCSHSGSTRPRSWNVSWKPASLAQECCLSYLIRSCWEGVGTRVWEEEGSLAAACLLLGPSLAPSPLAHKGLPPI